MLSTKTILSVLALALAADSDDTCSSSASIQSQSDADKLSSCSEFKGDITIKNTDVGTLTLNGIQKIKGSLRVENATQLTALNAPSVQSISEDFSLKELTRLNQLSFPELTEVGSIEFVTLPDLLNLQFNKGVSDAKNVIITDTQLRSLNGLNLSEVETFNINNNFYINEIDVGVTSVSNVLDISFNSNDVVVKLNELEWCNNATFRFCSSVSIPKLEKVNNSLGFINNTVQTIAAPKLTEIGGSLAIVSNGDLGNASFSNVEKIGGGFQVANNTKLNSLTGFSKVKSIGGAIDIVGKIKNVQLPNLEVVAGGVTVDSTENLNCSSFDTAHSKGVIRGDHYVCKGASHTTSVTGDAVTESGSQKTASGASKDKDSSSNAAFIAGSSVFGAVAAALLSFL